MQRKLQLTAMRGYSITRVRKQYLADAQHESEEMAKRNDVRMRAMRSGWQKQNEEGKAKSTSEDESTSTKSVTSKEE